MKLSPEQTSQEALARLGAEVIALIESRNFSTLAGRFGYALAQGRNLAKAIEEDFDRFVAESGEGGGRYSPSINVKYFEPNDASLYAVVECIANIGDKITFEIDLIVTSDGGGKFITLEGINCVA